MELVRRGERRASSGTAAHLLDGRTSMSNRAESSFNRQRWPGMNIDFRGLQKPS
jgi:hypothetical protein